MLSIRSWFKKKKAVSDIRFVTLDETDSTNHYCLHSLQPLPEAHGDDPRMVVVTTEFQSAGRGQGSNSWESERGKNLLFSILCHPVWVPVRSQFIISECVALAIRDTLAEHADHFTVKWPNDIYWKDKKICGILIENRLSGGGIKDCVIGVGVNINQLEFRSDAPNPVSLSRIVGHDFERKALLDDIVRRFDENLKAIENGNYGDIMTRYLTHLYRSSGFHPYRDSDGEFEGALVTVEEDGHLVLRDRDGVIRSYAFKEVEFLSDQSAPS